MYIMKFKKEKSAGYMTNWAARSFAKAMAARLVPHGLTTAHFPVFFALMNQIEKGETTGLTQKELAESAGIEQPTMAATLARMKRDGLVRMAPNPNDGRSALVVLTEKSLSKSKYIGSAVQEVNAIALHDVSEVDRKKFLELLTKVIGSLERDVK